MTKEEHAKKIISLVSEYCLCQRVKKEVFASDKDYVDALKAHHAVVQAIEQTVQAAFDIARLHELDELLHSGTHCGLGVSACNHLRDTLSHFGQAYAQGRAQWTATGRSDVLGTVFTPEDVAQWVTQPQHPWHVMRWDLPLVSDAPPATTPATA